MTLDRREFLSMAAASAAMMVTRPRADHDSTSYLRAVGQPELLAALGPNAVHDIGQAYRALVPAESDQSSLHALLRAARSSDVDPVHADFSAGRVIVVHDWVLSRTEARQCALFSLRTV